MTGSESIKTISCLPVGTEVLIGENIQGRITGIGIRDNKGVTLRYEIEWWNGRDRKEAWIPAIEVLPKSDAPGLIRIGFAINE